MCSPLFEVATCLLYTACMAYLVAFAWGHRSWSSLILFLLLGLVLGFQIDSDCNIAYTKIGAGILALMLFCTCGSVYKILKAVD